MLNTIIFFLPCFVCMVWFMLLLFRKKNHTQKILNLQSALFALHFVGNAAFISHHTPFEWWCIWDMIHQPLILCLITTGIFYIKAQSRNTSLSKIHAEYLYIPAIIQAIVVWLMYFVIGPENVVRMLHASTEVRNNTELNGWELVRALPEEFQAQQYTLFYLFDTTINSILSIILSLVLAALCIMVSREHGYRWGDGWRVWFKGQVTTPERAACYWSLLIILAETPFFFPGRSYIQHRPALGLLITVVVSVSFFCLCYCEYFRHIVPYTIYNLSHIDITSTATEQIHEAEASKQKEGTKVGMNAGSKVSLATVANGGTKEGTTARLEEGMNEDTIARITEEEETKNKPSTVLTADEKTALLTEELQKKITIEKVFRNKDLTLESLAKEMNTNRNRLSALVNQIYGEDFRNVIARERIEEAKNFMLITPGATSEEIAAHCGFKDTSTFFHKFKDIMGTSPRNWMAGR